MLYADIFNYPLTAKEIFLNNVKNTATEKEINDSLKSLCKQGIIHQHDFFYSLRNDRDIYENRIEKNKLAKKFKNRGVKISRFISYFPFVRAVFLSGSISKDCMEKDGDIDYFIITTPNRLWVARTILILFKKIMLFNSYKFFCLNYFIDTDHLEIQEKNIYTATEIVTLIPTFGKEVCDDFMASNKWVKKYRPNFPLREQANLASSKPAMFKRFIEFLLGGRLGNSLEKFFLNVTAKFWQQKFRNFSGKDYELSIKSKKHLSQINPENFQKKVLVAYDEKVKAFEEKHAISLI